MNRFKKALSLAIAVFLLVQLAVPVGAIEIFVSSYTASDLKRNFERREYDKVPLYLQNDYPDVRYGAGTVESSGCSIVSLAMVATYLTGYEYTPDTLAWYFGGSAENNIERLENGADTLQLPYEKTWNCYEALDAVKEGKIVIALMEQTSVFTDSQHFIVITGVTEDEKYLVNDSFAPNHDLWNLKTGFAEGFTEYEMITGFSGAWIFDKNDIPEDPFIYYKERPSMENSRYPGISLTYEETQLLAKVIWVEARGECAEGQQAVAEVVLNRMVSDGFCDTLMDVIYGEGQFRSVPFLNDAEPYQAQYDAIEAALYGPNVLPIDVYYFATEKTNDNVWGEIGGHVFCYGNGTEVPQYNVLIPDAPVETAPVIIPDAPVETAPVIIPDAPVETTPTEPQQTVPAETQETTPTVPQETVPAETQETTPTVPQGTTPTEPQNTTPAAPQETQPAVSESENTVSPASETPAAQNTEQTVPQTTEPAAQETVPQVTESAVQETEAAE